MNVQPSVRAFRSAITDAQELVHREVNPRVTGTEMKAALSLLPASSAGLRAAEGMLKNSNIPLNGSAQRHLQAFIDSNTDALPATGVKTFSSAQELKDALNGNSSFAEEVFRAAFGSNRSRSSSAEVQDVRMHADGSFAVDVELVHFRTQQQQSAGTVMISAAGVVDSSAVGLEPLGPPPTATVDVSAVEKKYDDTGAQRHVASTALNQLGMGRLTRSDSVRIGDITAGPMGSFFMELQVAHFMRPDDVRADLRLQLDSKGEFMGATEKPAAPTADDVTDTGDGAAPVSAIELHFADVGTLRRLGEDTSRALGQGRLTRSDAVDIDSITAGPMGSHFVDITVRHFMRADDVRFTARVQVKFDGAFVGAVDTSAT